MGSKINDNGSHDYDAKITMEIDESSFDAAMIQALYLAGHNSYDINDYNCTNYAIEVFNTVRDSSSEISIPDWTWGPKNFGQTPNGLYKEMAEMKANGDNSVEIGAANAPYKTGTCPDQ